MVEGDNTKWKQSKRGNEEHINRDLTERSGKAVVEEDDIGWNHQRQRSEEDTDWMKLWRSITNQDEAEAGSTKKKLMIPC